MSKKVLERKLRFARKQLYQRTRKLRKPGKPTRSPYDMNGLKEYPGD
jgi:hypothetical protein